MTEKQISGCLEQGSGEAINSNDCRRKSFMAIETSSSWVWSSLQDHIVTKFSSNFEFKMGDFYHIKLFLATGSWTDWKEAGVDRGSQQGGYRISLFPPVSYSPFPIALQLERLTEQNWGTWFLPNSLGEKGSNHHATLVTLSASGLFPRMLLG